jgi:1,4-alpha-glucan branching enzyme
VRAPVRYDRSPLGELDLHLLAEGTHTRLYDKLGAHPVPGGTQFAVWAPSAREVAVIGDFNGWAGDPLKPRGSSGVWEGLVPGVGDGATYKYRIVAASGAVAEKSDPVAFEQEVAPRTASIVRDLDTYAWGDGAWMAGRAERNALTAPWSVYEVHLGSWMRVPEEGDRPLTYRELGPKLAAYVNDMGFTHVELMPVMEHPFYGSWGYQVTGYFAPTSRYGTAVDFMAFIDCLHQAGIGVILDWVPSHFARDGHGLGLFDGTHLYEHADPRQGEHPDWHSYIFNLGRREVRSFLLSSARFWLERCHADGLRVDAVASMLYLDYSRRPGEWVPNAHGGRENLEAIDFLRRFNQDAASPEVQTIAEESTAWPGVTDPAGLGFGMKWDMGWMHDSLAYLALDPVHRSHHHREMTFRGLYAFTERFMMPLSHDEVVHGKGSLIARMSGDDWQKAANLRLLFAWQYAQPGKKLIFMGGELGQWREWSHERSLDWHLLAEPAHAGIQRWVRDLNMLYRGSPSLAAGDFDSGATDWFDMDDSGQSVIAFRRGQLLFALNFTPVPRMNYRVGVPLRGSWREILNSDARDYGGSGYGNLGSREAAPVPSHGQPFSLNLTLPPLAAVVFEHA